MYIHSLLVLVYVIKKSKNGRISVLHFNIPGVHRRKEILTECVRYRNAIKKAAMHVTWKFGSSTRIESLRRKPEKNVFFGF